MFNSHFLTAHHDIRAWVLEQHGCPAIALTRDRDGAEKAQLRLKFVRYGDEEALDGQTTPCSWTAWLAELDRQQLALRVDPSGDYALVPRNTVH